MNSDAEQVLKILNGIDKLENEISDLEDQNIQLKSLADNES